MSAIEDALDEYQKFTQSTAVYPEMLALPYLALGLGDEAGELLEKVTQVTAGSNSSAWRDGVAAEAGDVLWYFAQLLLQLDLSLGGVWRASESICGTFEASFSGAASEVSIAASGLQGRIKKKLRDGVLDDKKTFSLACRLLRALGALCRYCGTNLPLVAYGNQMKLTDRLSRSVIKGEGDHR